MSGKRRSPGDGTLYKRADGLWVGGVELPANPDGKRRIKRVTSKNRNVVLQKLRALQAALAAGAIPTAPSTTMQRWLEYWFSDILPHRTSAGSPLKPATIDGYERTIRRYLIPYIGAKRLDRITPAEIRALYQTLTEVVSSRAAQKADQVLRLAVKAAIREGVVYANVMDRVDKPGHIAKEATSFDAKTAMHIIETAVTTRGAMWGARWAFGFLTGARESEILGLERDRVDLEAGIVDISWQLQRLPRKHGCGQPVEGKHPCGFTRPAYCPDTQWAFPRGDYRECVGTLCWTRPKTKAGRRLIPLVPELVDILRRIEHDQPNPHGLVFHNPDGRPIDQEQDQKAWKQLLIDAGIPHTNQHTIRHSTATLLLEAGVDVHVVQSVIGHTDIATTRGYQHVNMALAREAWGNLSALLPADTPKQGQDVTGII